MYYRTLSDVFDISEKTAGTPDQIKRSAVDLCVRKPDIGELQIFEQLVFNSLLYKLDYKTYYGDNKVLAHILRSILAISVSVVDTELHFC